MKNMKKIHSRFLIMTLFFFFAFMLSFSAQASEGEESRQKAVVFLLDASGSMTGNDPNRYAIDSIAQLIYTLPTNYEVGFLAYNSDICTLQGFLGNSQRSRIMDAAETVGGVYYSHQALDIQTAIDSITENQLSIRQMTAAIVDAGENTENVDINMPFAHAGTVRVLLTSDSSINNLKTNFTAESAKQIGGERYSLIEIERPKGDRLNESIQLWTEEYFNHSKLSFLAEDKEEEKTLEAGQVLLKERVTEDSVKKISFTCEKFPANVLSISEVEISLEGPPLLPVEEPEDPSYVLYGMAVLAALFLILILLVLLRRGNPRNTFAPEEPYRPAPGNSSYIGRLNIYITRTKSGYDISPLAYDLFRLPANRVISISEILENCGIRETFQGAQGIYLSSGQGRSIILTNQSDCCIMKSGEILMKKKSYQLFTESKVDITFEDEISELTFQYKDLKPSEMY
ncbi:MAG: VWA domain-containing protein [Roseburia sp.]|nr:VWA domain-containing protein [Roseburia sp.]